MQNRSRRSWCVFALSLFVVALSSTAACAEGNDARRSTFKPDAPLARVVPQKQVAPLRTQGSADVKTVVVGRTPLEVVKKNETTVAKPKTSTVRVGGYDFEVANEPSTTVGTGSKEPAGTKAAASSPKAAAPSAREGGSPTERAEAAKASASKSNATSATASKSGPATSTASKSAPASQKSSPARGGSVGPP